MATNKRKWSISLETKNEIKECKIFIVMPFIFPSG